MILSKLRRFIFDGVSIGFIFCVLVMLVLDPSEEQWLNLGINSIIAILCFGVAVAVSFMLSKMGLKTLGMVFFETKPL